MQMTTEQFDLIKKQFTTLKDRSPFYAKKFEGIDLADVQTQKDFEQLPILRKGRPAQRLSSGAAGRARRRGGAHPFVFGHHGHARSSFPTRSRT